MSMKKGGNEPKLLEMAAHNRIVARFDSTIEAQRVEIELLKAAAVDASQVEVVQKGLVAASALMFELSGQKADIEERAVFAEGQLTQLGLKKNCIGGCGFENDSQRIGSILWELDKELGTQPPYENGRWAGLVWGDTDSAEWNANNIRKGFAALREVIANREQLLMAADASAAELKEQLAAVTYPQAVALKVMCGLCKGSINDPSDPEKCRCVRRTVFRGYKMEKVVK